MQRFANAYGRNFLGETAPWYKLTIVGFLILNPILFFYVDPYLAGWVLVAEFIFTLAMALKCYPLQPGGLLALEAIAIGMSSTGTVVHEIEGNLEVILLLVFMVAGIYFLQKMLLFMFTKLLVSVRSKVLLSLTFSLSAAILSAFLDALTVTAVIIAVSVGFYSIYHKVASGKDFDTDGHNHGEDDHFDDLTSNDLEQFRSFLRSLVMHAAVGTALGGVSTLVGEPQNIVIATKAGWDFAEFFWRMAPVSIPVLIIGLSTCVGLEMTKKFGYGAAIPSKVMNILQDYDAYETERMSSRDKAAIVVQGIVAIWLVFGLMYHLAAPGLIGLSVIILATAFTGITDEHQIGKAFTEALPFTALLVVFFAIVAVIADQQLFVPVIHYVLTLEPQQQIPAFYIANGVLSAVSDNVFVATVYISEIGKALLDGTITRDVYDLMAVAINTGTNIPSVATPNGQAAFLFLLTSALAPLIRLSYMKMVFMALPYTITMSITGYIAVAYFLVPATDVLYDKHIIEHHADHSGASTQEHAPEVPLESNSH